MLNERWMKMNMDDLKDYTCNVDELKSIPLGMIKILFSADSEQPIEIEGYTANTQRLEWDEVDLEFGDDKKELLFAVVFTANMSGFMTARDLPGLINRMKSVGQIPHLLHAEGDSPPDKSQMH